MDADGKDTDKPEKNSLPGSESAGRLK